MKLKKKRLFIGMMLSIGCFSGADDVFSQQQPDQTVIVGSTYIYSTTISITGSTFTWNVTGGTNGTNFNYTPSDTTDSLTIQWLRTGTYTVQVTEVSPQGCTNPSAPYNYVVQCINAPTIEFDTSSSAACSGAANTDLTLSLSFTDTVVYPIVVNYTIDGTPYQRTINSGTSISLGSEENILVNNTASDVTRVIIITSATSHGASLNIGTNDTHNYTVYATPQLNPITHN
ncbi:MAG: hypothetical protein ACP5PZ_11250 [Bacteroidales bacterium]